MGTTKRANAPAGTPNSPPERTNTRRQETRNPQQRTTVRRKSFTVRPRPATNVMPSSINPYDTALSPPSPNPVFDPAHQGVFNLEEDMIENNIRTHVIPTSYPEKLHVQSLPDTRINSRRQEFNPRNPASTRRSRLQENARLGRPIGMSPDASPDRLSSNDSRGSPPSDWPSSSRTSRLRSKNMPKSDPIVIPARVSRDSNQRSTWAEYERNRRANQAVMESISRFRAQSMQPPQQNQGPRYELSSSSSEDNFTVRRPRTAASNSNRNRK